MHQINKIEIDKSPAGPDNISARLLKETNLELCKPLTTLFKRSIAESKLPDAWKEAQIVPIYKKGQKSKPGNYRPISLTSVVGKVLERLVKEEIMNFLEENNLLSQSQFGFRNGRSCQLQLLE